MPRNRIIYNVQDVFVGPATLYDFKILHNTHVLQRLDRVQTFDYSINFPRNDVRSVGKRDIVHIQNAPIDVGFNFDYYLSDISNELRQGLNVAHNINGNPQTSSSGNLFNGIADTRDNASRNFYVIINRDSNDTRNYSSAAFTGTSGSISDYFDSRATGYTLVTLANSYLQSYSLEASIGEFPRAKVQYVADSIIVNDSASEITVPVVDNVNGFLVSSPVKVAISNPYLNAAQPSVLKPGDMTLSHSNDLGYDFRDGSFDWNDLKIQSFSWSFEVIRDNILYLGEKLYCDRVAKNPIISNFTLNGLVGDYKSGFLQNFINDDNSKSGHFIVTIRNPYSGALSHQQTSLRLEAKGAKITNFGTSESLGANKAFTLSFSCDNSPDNMAEYGVFLSGYLAPPPTISGVCATQISEYLKLEDDSILRLEDIVVTPTTF